MRSRKRRRLPNGEEFLVDREARWAVRISIAGGIVCGLISWSFWWGLVAVWLVWLGIEAMTLIWEEIELFRGNNPYADRRAESELIREERLRKERQEEERRQLTFGDRCRQLIALVRRRGRQGDDRDEQGPSDEP
jgi:hypothetical protein